MNKKFYENDSVKKDMLYEKGNLEGSNVVKHFENNIERQEKEQDSQKGKVLEVKYQSNKQNLADECAQETAKNYPKPTSTSKICDSSFLEPYSASESEFIPSTGTSSNYETESEDEEIPLQNFVDFETLPKINSSERPSTSKLNANITETSR